MHAGRNRRYGEPQVLDTILGRVSGGDDLSMDEMAETIGLMMDGGCADDQIALLLTALRSKGECVDEVAGAAQAMRQHMVKIPSQHENLLDTCGTGGDASGTFNISTAAAIVASAAGAHVAKHGNRSITSKSGSSQVLEALGVNIGADVDQVGACLDEAGICFCFAPLMHPSMKQVAAVRRQLGVPTIFNMLGPLCNPAGAPFQLLGVGRAEMRPLLAAALLKLGTQRSLVVHGTDGLDEVTLSGATLVTEVVHGELNEFEWHPSEFGLATAGKEEMMVEGPEASAALIERILGGQAGAPRDIVILNAAAALFTVGIDRSPQKCAGLAGTAIDSGAARRQLDELIRVSNAG
jgi:anthranilate phosphoribosyltransferase